MVWKYLFDSEFSQRHDIEQLREELAMKRRRPWALAASPPRSCRSSLNGPCVWARGRGADPRARGATGHDSRRADADDPAHLTRRTVEDGCIRAGPGPPAPASCGAAPGQPAARGPHLPATDRCPGARPCRLRRGDARRALYPVRRDGSGARYLFHGRAVSSAVPVSRPDAGDR